MPVSVSTRAPAAGALFVSGLFFLSLADASSAANGRCPAPDYHDRGSVLQVFDGDTLELADGRRVRLLGIDTPETGGDERPAEPLAGAATARLEFLAGAGTRIRLRYDLERHDRYGRLLAHVFLDDGVNVQAALVSAGLAVTLVVPPNEWNHACYAALERAARSARRGVWALDRYRAVAASALHGDARGFRIVTGRVARIGEGRKNIWLNLTPGFAVRIPKSDLAHFRNLDPRSLLGRRLEVRGFVARRKGELRLAVRHPAALRLLDGVE